MKKILSISILTLAVIASALAQTTLTIYPDKDAELFYGEASQYSHTPTTNYGESTLSTALEWTASGLPWRKKGLIGIDLSGLPSNAIITEAKLYLYGTGSHRNDITMGSSSYKSNASYLRRVTTAWDEHTVTWNTAPTTVTNNQVTLSNSTIIDQDYVVDVTALIKDIQADPDNSDGLMMNLVTASYYTEMRFGSSDNALPSLRPKLEITYELNRPFTETEGFEYPNTLWENVDGDNIDWTVKSGSTGSSGTGPSSASTGSYYAYVEASSPNYPNKTAYLQSAIYFLNGLYFAALNFDYHMYGTAMGSLKLQVTTDAGRNWNDIWVKSGNQGNEWHSAQLDLSAYAGEIIMLRFVGNTGSSYTSDMALDNIEIDAAGNRTAAFSSDQNYIATTVPQTDNGLSGHINQSIKYFDGLGRLSQEIGIGISPAGNDLVKPVVYDISGRIERDYLPYSASYNTYGEFRNYDWENASSHPQKTFYQDHFDLGSNDPYAYSKTVYENSPLNRILFQGSPGETWQPTGGASDKVLEFEYGSNIQNEVQLFTVNQTSGALENLLPYYYSASELYKNTFSDEDGHHTEEFKDKLGQVVLKRSYDESTQFSTYYVYDDFGLLRYVIPPKADGDGGLPSPTEIDQLCYQYKYDSRKRMAEKKLPGAEPVFMVYDDRDRLVLTQDGEMRADNRKEWLYTQYDTINRPVVTGIYYNTIEQDQAQIQEDVNDFYEIGSNPYYVTETLTTAGPGYTNVSFPGSAANCQVYTETYYDSYSFRDRILDFDGMTYDNIKKVDDYFDDDGDTDEPFNRVKGQITGSATLVLDGTNSNWVRTINYYDDKYRLIQQQQKMYPSGTSMISSRYDFIGKVMETFEMQTVNTVTNEILQEFDYDHAGRLVNTYLTVNEEEDPILLANLEYNELGELEEKNVHAEIDNFTSFLQNIDYSYNIRGWLTSINDPESLGSDKFGMELYYDKYDGNILNIPTYNGNISAIAWAREGISNKKAYSYEYDDLNRLTKADYSIRGSTGIWTYWDHYDTDYTYDMNGNISLLLRNDDVGVRADGLVYTYSGNQISSVTDMEDPNSLYCDRNINTSFEYDENGNMTKEQDKGLLIDYNYLNLPEKVYKLGSPPDQISYVYDAAGTKWLKKYTYNYTSMKNTMYAGAFVYEDPTGINAYSLDYLINSEGVIEMSGSTLIDYQYFLKDHLGNTRVTINASGGPSIQNPDYYPFGMSFENTLGDDNKYLYNGKELQDEQLGGVNLDWYDYGARFYDPALGRWHVLDNSAENYTPISPYSYSFNNPIRFIDPDGNDPSDVINAANLFLGTYYEWGGKNPASTYIGIYNTSSQFGRSMYSATSNALYNQYQNSGYEGKSSLYALIGLFGPDIPTGNSFGVDCSGLAALSFNSDPDKLMGDLKPGRANDQMNQFANAEADGSGLLHSEFNDLGKGDIVFGTNKKGRATHAMVATGNVKVDADGNVTRYEVTHSPGSGKTVTTNWKKVGKSQKIGHTYRQGEYSVKTGNELDDIMNEYSNIMDFIDNHQNTGN